MKKILQIILLGSAVFLIGCSSTARFTSGKKNPDVRYSSSKNETAQSNIVMQGMASYYGPKYHGRKTASGEVFDMYQFTAAHQQLPFGTKLKVTNLSNGKTVTVRVNDRGPFVGNRILDLSYGAAKQLDMLSTGVTEVKLEKI